MAIQNVQVKNSRIGVHSGFEKPQVMQLVSIIIQYEEIDKIEKRIELGLRKRTRLSFFTETYFGIISAKDLELYDEDGNLINTILMPKGKVIALYNNWFIMQQNKSVYAYDKTGKVVADGIIPEDGNKSLVLNLIDDKERSEA